MAPPPPPPLFAATTTVRCLLTGLNTRQVAAAASATAAPSSCRLVHASGGPASASSASSSSSSLQPPTVGKMSGEELWMAGVAGRVKVWAARSYPALKGRDKEIAETVRREFEATLARRLAPGSGGSSADADAAATPPASSSSPSASSLPDLAQSSPRARAQLRQACLAAATQRVFARELGGGADAEREAAAAVAEAMGSIHAPFFLGALKATTWFKRAILRRDAFDQACETLDRLGRDMSGAAAVERLPPHRGPGDGDSDGDSDGEEGAEGGPKSNKQHATLRVSSCGVAELLRAEGVAELLAPSFCCAHARWWFDAYASQGVGASLDRSLMMMPSGGGGGEGGGGVGSGGCRLRIFTTKSSSSSSSSS
jgi:hypothetical protein